MTVRRRSQRAAPVPIEELNRRCKICVLRYVILIACGISLMTYFVPYEQPNVPYRHPLLDESDVIIMSYNMRAAGIDKEATTKWRARKKPALQMINMYKPDIIGLQEARRNQLESLKQNGYNSYSKLIATSILYKKDNFTMIDGDTLWLSQTPHIEGSTSWDASQERVVTWILVTSSNVDKTAQCEEEDTCELISPDDAYLVFNTHLDHKGEKSRAESCIVIKDVIYNISTIKYHDKYPVFLTGDFNEAKYANVWKCLTADNDVQLRDALHTSEYFGYRRKLKLQYTDHRFRGLQMNTWYMRAAQYAYFGCSNSVVKWFRNIWFDGVCCFAPSLYRQIFRKFKYKQRAGIHHLDWILYTNHTKMEKITYFEVVSYHHTIEKDEQPALKWSLKGLFYDRIISKAIYPSDHFPVLAGFNLK